MRGVLVEVSVETKQADAMTTVVATRKRQKPMRQKPILVSPT
jgi:hypothetical protein